MEAITQSETKRSPGRPKGQKNKPGSKAGRPVGSYSDRAKEPVITVKRPRGRPKKSKTKTQKESNQTYYAKHADKVRAGARRYYYENRERICAARRAATSTEQK